jgi:hypothetical protein
MFMIIEVVRAVTFGHVYKILQDMVLSGVRTEREPIVSTDSFDGEAISLIDWIMREVPDKGISLVMGYADDDTTIERNISKQDLLTIADSEFNGYIRSGNHSAIAGTLYRFIMEQDTGIPFKSVSEEEARAIEVRANNHLVKGLTPKERDTLAIRLHREGKAITEAGLAKVGFNFGNAKRATLVPHLKAVAVCDRGLPEEEILACNDQRLLQAIKKASKKEAKNIWKEAKEGKSPVVTRTSKKDVMEHVIPLTDGLLKSYIEADLSGDLVAQKELASAIQDMLDAK